MEQLLIVEDDIGLNQGLCKSLKADDRQIISCHDLKAAREQLLCGSVSLILLDINLPDGSGLELLREVKENMPGVPVILLTANDTDLDIVMLRRLTMKALQKVSKFLSDYTSIVVIAIPQGIPRS